MVSSYFKRFPYNSSKRADPNTGGKHGNTELLPLGTEQGREETEYSSFDLCLGESFVSPLVEQHRQWLKSIRHETPSPKIPFKVAVYIRFLIRRNMGTRNISSVTKRFSCYVGAVPSMEVCGLLY